MAGSGTVVALGLALALACAHRQGPTDLPRDDLTKALDALERKVCLTIGDDTNGPRDQCEPQVDRSTYLQPLREVFLAAPPILKAYLCSLDRLYFDYHSPWNASFSVFPDSQTGSEYRSIAVRRGVLENKVPLHRLGHRLDPALVDRRAYRPSQQRSHPAPRGTGIESQRAGRHPVSSAGA